MSSPASGYIDAMKEIARQDARIEALEEALRRTTDELMATFHALSDEKQREYGPLHAQVVGRAHKLLSTLSTTEPDHG